MNTLRIALIAQGRFHMFDLARELIRLGHDVSLLTNYPYRSCERFGLPRSRVRTVTSHRYLYRSLGRLMPRRFRARLERAEVTSFGQWAARVLAGEAGRYDVIASMSGVATPLFHRLRGGSALTVLHRGSSHIRVQRQILDAEAERAGVSVVDRPSDWTIAREEAEYEAADRVVVLSPFARDSFARMNTPAHKLGVIQPGVETRLFRADEQDVADRRRRVLSGERLRLLCVGGFNLRKGAGVWDDVLSSPLVERFEVRFVGDIGFDARHIAARHKRVAEFRSRVPHHHLPAEYRWGDLFVFPTLEEGFPAVVNQAQAAALPILATAVCRRSRDDWDGVCGWRLPDRDPSALLGMLLRLDADRPAVAAAVAAAVTTAGSSDWTETAQEYTRLLAHWRDQKTAALGC